MTHRNAYHPVAQIQRACETLTRLLQRVLFVALEQPQQLLHRQCLRTAHTLLHTTQLPSALCLDQLEQQPMRDLVEARALWEHFERFPEIQFDLHDRQRAHEREITPLDRLIVSHALLEQHLCLLQQQQRTMRHHTVFWRTQFLEIRQVPKPL